ncbi:hypothetical protein DNTS_028766, partial [Danionella cerebrum]
NVNYSFSVKYLLNVIFFLSPQISVSASTPSSSTDDLYLEDLGSGGKEFPEDDDDFSSASGSGEGEDIESVTINTLFIEPKAKPTQDSTKDFTPRVESTTEREIPIDNRKRMRTELPPAPVTEDWLRNPVTSSSSPPRSPFDTQDVQSENLFQRTEVLAGKDEGSYDLGERKPSGAAYQKAPTKEFYA